MKKLLTAIGSLLIFAGLKAQTDNTPKKETTPLVKNNSHILIDSSDKSIYVKNVSSKGATVKGNPVAVKIVSPKDIVVKGITPVTVKGNPVTVKGSNIIIKDPKLAKLDTPQKIVKLIPVVKK